MLSIIYRQVEVLQLCSLLGRADSRHTLKERVHLVTSEALTNMASAACAFLFQIPPYIRAISIAAAGMSNKATAQLQQHLDRTMEKNCSSRSFINLQAWRAELPAAAVREECLQLLQEHQVGAAFCWCASELSRRTSLSVLCLSRTCVSQCLQM